MSHSVNHSAADTLSITLETIDEAQERAETEEEQQALIEAREAVEEARDTILEREAPTPTQQLIQALGGDIR